MKKTVLILALIAVTVAVKAQALEEFYNKPFEIYTPFSKISAKSASMDTLGMKSGMGFWGIVDIGCTVSNTKKWGFSATIGTRQIGDLFYILRGLLAKEGKQRNFRDQYYLSDLGFLPNMRLGLNVYARDNMVVNLGLYNSYYITYAAFVHDGSVAYENVHLLSAGPNIYVDRAINEWLAARISTGPMFPYAVMPKYLKEEDNVPKLWESRIEVFTKWGFFAGVDILNMHGFHDLKDDNMKVNRLDLRLGIRVKL